jgi:putative inorganic carbon (hco3(-)) transporter
MSEKVKSRSVIITSLTVVVSLLISFIVAKAGIMAGATAIVASLVFMVVLVSLINYRDGFLITVVYSFFVFHIGRMLFSTFSDVPVGIGVDALLLLVLVSILFYNLRNYRNPVTVDERMYKNPIAYALYAYIGYAFLLLFHPSSLSVIGRVIALRETLAMVLLFVIVLFVFQSVQFIKSFLKFWLFLALLAALYGVYQEYMGLQSWELNWLHANPTRVKLALIWGHVRKWSFLSDINAFGLFMSYSGIIALILSLGPFAAKKRILLALGGIVMLISMTFSGTRTAMAMVAFGFLFFAVSMLNNKKMIIFCSVAIAVALCLIYGPFYGPTFSRIRSTLNVSDDASMNVRNETRARVQPYILSHPFGGGLNTAGSFGLANEPDHPLAGEWDPDSGYLKTALERGMVGLAIQLVFYASILLFGLTHYYRSIDPEHKIIYIAYLSGFFALSVANFAQDSMEQKPVSLILMASIATILKLSTFTTSK